MSFKELEGEIEEKLEVLDESITIYYCPYCNSKHEDEWWAEQCREACYERRKKVSNGS